MGTGGALVGISYGLAGYVELYQEVDGNLLLIIGTIIKLKMSKHLFPCLGNGCFCLILDSSPSNIVLCFGQSSFHSWRSLSDICSGM